MSFFILFIPSCAVPNAYAYLFTDDTSTTEPGHCTVDFWTQYYKDTYFQDGDKSRTRETKLYLYSTYGLTNNWDIGITIPYGFLNYDRTTKTNGFMDIDIETKMRFFEETNLAPSLALYINYITASANEEKSLGSGDQDLWINGIFSKTLNDNLWLDCNLGYYFTGGKASDDVCIYSVALAQGYYDRLYIYGELYGETEFEVNFNNNVSIVALSVGYEINQIVFVKTGVACGISDAANDLQLSGRLSLSF